MNFFGGGNNN
jgi:ubiquitin fusion degradation protein 1